jgi:mannose-1-phosphate guanylyltransferase
VTSALPPALLLAAGLGTRLRPLTFCRAKAAVPVAGIPLVCRHLTALAAQGVRDVVVNLHHRPETIAGVVGDGGALGCRVRYSWERSLLGSAGGPRRALPLLGDSFLLVNGDTLCDIDLTALVDTHQRCGARVTLAVTSNPAPHRYGGVLAGDDGWVTGFAGPGDPRRPWHFVGVQIADAAVFTTLTDGVVAASIGGLYDTLLTGHSQVAIHRVTGRFHDIGTPADYLETNRAMGAGGDGEVSRGTRTVVHPSARVERSILWDDVSVGPGCVVIDSVLADGVRLRDGTLLDRQAVVRLPSEHDGAFALPPGAARIGDLLTVPL